MELLQDNFEVDITCVISRQSRYNQLCFVLFHSVAETPSGKWLERPEMSAERKGE